MAVRIQVVMNKLNVKWRETRWALVLALVANTSYPDGDGFASTTSITINDESSPGSFKVSLMHLSTSTIRSSWRKKTQLDKMSLTVNS